MSQFDQFPDAGFREEQPRDEVSRIVRLGMGVGNLALNLIDRRNPMSNPVIAIRERQAAHDAQLAAIDELVGRLSE